MKCYDAPIVVQLQVTTPADCAQLPPPVTEAETYVDAEGMVIVSTGIGSLRGAVVEERVGVRDVAGIERDGVGEPLTLMTRRSIWSLTVTDPLAVLLALFESGSVAGDAGARA